MKKVSLYIPCFNAEKHIKFCLDAVLKQDFPVGEILIIDDGSTDRTSEIASSYPVKIIKHSVNKGLSSARNTAIKEAKFNFLASLDADCVPDVNWLGELMSKFNSPKTAGVGGKLLESYSSTIFDLWRSVHMKQYWEDKTHSPSFLFGSNGVFRKKMLVTAGLYGKNFKNNYEDVDMCKRLKEKGYALIYQPEAVTHHLKQDNICSILDTYWNWNLGYYLEKKYYSDQESFLSKIKDNIGLANRYMEEDIDSKRYQLLYLDFLLALHHSLKDFDFFLFQKNALAPSRSKLSFWLSLSDLAFFYHFDYAKKEFSTLMPRKESFLQNFFALILILDKHIRGVFTNNDFRNALYHHLLLSVCKIDNNNLLNTILNLVESHESWDELLKKRQPNIDKQFLKNLSSFFEDWLKNLTRFPNVIQLIEISAEKTNKLSYV